MAIPSKRHEQNGVNYLDLDEVKALIAAPDRTTWLGRRDHALMLLTVLTGVRVTELATLRVGDVSLAAGAHIKLTGKGRKRRAVTLTPETVAVLRQWLKERHGQPDDPLFPSRRDTADPLRHRDPTRKARRRGGRPVSIIVDKRVTPHTLSHTNAMLLRAGATSTSRRSRSGWDTKASRPPASTSTPTQRSKNKQPRGSPRWAPSPADTTPRTRSSRS